MNSKCNNKERRMQEYKERSDKRAAYCSIFSELTIALHHCVNRLTGFCPMGRYEKAHQGFLHPGSLSRTGRRQAVRVCVGLEILRPMQIGSNRLTRV